MQVLRTVAELRAYNNSLVRGHTVGFVPTMGNLHQGHAQLIKRAAQENTSVIVSIFINPLQFNVEQDYTRYPRTIEQDIALCQTYSVAAVFIPEVSELYAQGASSYRVEETELSRCLEGQYRPGHFAGMLTVVLKLLQLVQPTRAYFGAKDYQQGMLVLGLVRAFF